MEMIYVFLGIVGVTAVIVLGAASRSVGDVSTTSDEHADIGPPPRGPGRMYPPATAHCEASRPPRARLAAGAHLTVVGSRYVSEGRRNANDEKETSKMAPDAMIFAKKRHGLTGADLLRRVGT